MQLNTAYIPDQQILHVRLTACCHLGLAAVVMLTVQVLVES